jgi:hypothetical protein
MVLSLMAHNRWNIMGKFVLFPLDGLALGWVRWRVIQGWIIFILLCCDDDDWWLCLDRSTSNIFYWQQPWRCTLLLCFPFFHGYRVRDFHCDSSVGGKIAIAPPLAATNPNASFSYDYFHTSVHEIWRGDFFSAFIRWPLSVHLSWWPMASDNSLQAANTPIGILTIIMNRSLAGSGKDLEI